MSFTALSSHAVAIVGDDGLDRLDLSTIGADRLEGRRYVFEDSIDTELRCNSAAKPQRVTGGMALRHEYPQDLVFPEGPRAQRRDDRTVDASRETDNHPATPQRIKNLLAQGPNDAIDLRASIEHQSVLGEF